MEAWIALVGAIFGGVGLKVVEHVLNRSRIKIDAATEIRQELRDEVGSLREEIKSMEDQVEHWRNRYYILLERFNEMKLKHNIQDYPFDPRQ